MSVRARRLQSSGRRSVLSYPDEIMIDWGKTPLGSVASIYWPEVSAASVLQLAAQLYPAQTLSAAEPTRSNAKWSAR